MTDLWQRLQQRKLVQWALVYLAASWGLLEMLDLAANNYGWSTSVVRLAFGVIALGFVITLLLAWYHGSRYRLGASSTDHQRGDADLEYLERIATRAAVDAGIRRVCSQVRACRLLGRIRPAGFLPPG